MKIRHILLTTDLSDEALLPAAPMAELARESGARITLVHVVQDLRALPRGAPLAPAVSSPDLPRREEEARAKLEAQRASFPADLEVKAELLSAENVAKTVVEHAGSLGVDLIALSTHGRSGLGHLALGSVAEAILRRSPVPVLCFPRPRD